MPHKIRLIPQEEDLTFFFQKTTRHFAVSAQVSAVPPCSVPSHQTQWWQEQDLLSASERKGSRGRKTGPDFVPLWSGALGNREMAQ